MRTFTLTLLFNFFLFILNGQVVKETSTTPGIREYRFQNTLTENNKNLPKLLPLDTMGRYVLDTLKELNNQTRIVYRFVTNAGVQFNNKLGNYFIGQSYSIELYFVFDDVFDFKRVIDWKDRSSDAGAYLYYGKLYFYPIVYADSTTVYDGKYTHFVLTRDSTSKVVKVYSDGNLGISFIDSTNEAIMDTNNVLNFFQDDTIIEDEASSGAISLMNIYNYVLDSATVKKNFNNLQNEIFSVQNLTKNGTIRIFPNPAKDNLMIDLKPLGAGGTVHVSLLDMTGTVVYSYQYEADQLVSLDLNTIQCRSGIYLVKVETDSGIITRKVVVSR